MKRLPFWCLVLGLLGLAGWGLWRMEIATRPAEGSPTQPDVPKVRPIEAPAVTGVVAPAVTEEARPVAISEVAPEAVVAEAMPARATAGEILAEPGDDFPKIAGKLAALAADPRVPAAERAEALAHTLNLSIGHEAKILTPLVTNPAVTDELASAILSEALNRPLAYQADLYLEALRARKETKMQEMIRGHLAFLTNGEDRGPDPAAWVDAIKAAKAEWER